MTESVNFRAGANADTGADEAVVEGAKEAGADDIAFLMKVLADGSRDWVRAHNLVNQACLRVLESECWTRLSKPDGTKFASFAQFACHARPAGLGVTNSAAAAILGRVLKAERKYREWAEILQLIAKEPGRPRKKTLADGEGSERFYAVSTSSGAVDRILYRMIVQRDGNAKVASAFDEVCAGKLTPAAASRKLRWGAREKPTRRLADQLLELDPESRAEALGDLFRRLDEQEREKLLEAVKDAGRIDAMGSDGPLEEEEPA